MVRGDRIARRALGARAEHGLVIGLSGDWARQNTTREGLGARLGIPRGCIRRRSRLVTNMAAAAAAVSSGFVTARNARTNGVRRLEDSCNRTA